MKINENFGPVLHLLCLALITRSSSANPIATMITPVVIKGVVAVTKSLTETMDWLEGKKFNSYKLDEAITKLETQIDELPIEIGVIHQKMLEGLYKSRSRVVVTRSFLEQFAVHLKSQCDALIALYNRNDVTIELVSYSVKRFVKLAINVKIHLNDALKLYKEIDDKLMESKAELKSYNFKLELKEGQHNEAHNEEIESQKTTFILVTVFTLGLGAPIAYPIIYGQIAVLEDKMKELQILIDQIQDTCANLVTENDEISDYVLKEISLIQIWDMQLGQSLSDHQPITSVTEAIKFDDIQSLRDNLVALRKACINYMNHDAPKKLQSLINETRGEFSSSFSK